MNQEERLNRLKNRYGRKIAAGGPGPDGPRGGPGGPRPGGPGRVRRLGGGRPKNSMGTIRRLLGYLRGDTPKLCLAFVCIILNTLGTLLGSYMLRPIINTYIVPVDGSRGDPAGLARALAWMAFVYLVGVGANYLQARIMLTVAQTALRRIRTDLFGKMQEFPVRFYDTNSNGDLMSRFTNDVDTVGMMLSNTLVQLFAGVLSIIGTLLLMIYTNIWLTLITLAMIPLMMKAGKEVAKRSHRHFSAQQESLGAVNGYIEEMITGQKVVKVFCHEDAAQEEFNLLNQDLRDNQIRAQFFGGIMGPVMGNLSQVNYSLTACIGGLLCIFRNFDVGGLTVFLNFSPWLILH